MIETNQVYLLIAKIVELVLYVAVFQALNKKYRGIPFKQRPSIHRFFLTGIGGWIIYMFFDSIIYVIAPLSIPDTIAVGETISGYPTAYPSLIIANILRDIGLPFALVMAWVYCAAAVQINNGININESIFFSEDPLFSDNPKIKILKGQMYRFLAVVVVIAIIALDRIEVHVIAEGQVHVTSGWGIVNTIFILGFFTYATYLMLKQLIFLNSSPMEAEYKRRARNLSLGIIIYTAGLYYWGLTGIIFKGLSAGNWLILVFLFLGHAIWSLSAIFIFLAFKSTDKEDNSEMMPNSEASPSEEEKTMEEKHIKNDINEDKQ